MVYLCIMKTVYIIRHAKSDWSIAGQTDIDRALNARGYNDAHNVGKVMKSKGQTPQLIISSPAIRALTTALIVSEELGYPKSQIRIEPLLYDTDVQEYEKVLKSLSNSAGSVVIFGHNPVVSDLSSFWAGKLVDMPTCAVVQFRILTDKWSQLSKENVEFVDLLVPKMI